jgi:hypothetical protein
MQELELGFAFNMEKQKPVYLTVSGLPLSF